MPDHLGAVLPVPARLWQWALVPVVGVEDGPARVAEGDDREDVAQQPRGLGVVDVELTLVARRCREREFGVRSSKLWELPDAGRLPPRNSTKVLRVFHQGHDAPAAPFAVLSGDDGSDGEMDEFVPILEPSPVCGRPLRRKAPRVMPVSYWLWRTVVGPWGSGP